MMKNMDVSSRGYALRFENFISCSHTNTNTHTHTHTGFSNKATNNPQITIIECHAFLVSARK